MTGDGDSPRGSAAGFLVWVLTIASVASVVLFLVWAVGQR